jgi:hypothetical protein
MESPRLEIRYLDGAIYLPGTSPFMGTRMKTLQLIVLLALPFLPAGIVLLLLFYVTH